MKKCTKCKQEKSLSEFYRKSARTDRTYCKRCFMDTIVERRVKRKLWAITYKGGKCENCGYNEHPEVLDFDHIDRSQKKYRPAQVLKYSMKKIKEELDNCRLLCANCHRLKTAGKLKF